MRAKKKKKKGRQQKKKGREQKKKGREQRKKGREQRKKGREQRKSEKKYTSKKQIIYTHSTNWVMKHDIFNPEEVMKVYSNSNLL